MDSWKIFIIDNIDRNNIIDLGVIHNKKFRLEIKVSMKSYGRKIEDANYNNSL